MLTIYKASAGSGKTFTLALEYIKALLGAKQPDGSYKPADLRRERNRHRHILAITFTNKATEEMKTRIIKELSDIAAYRPGCEPSDYARILAPFLHCDYETLAASASLALEQVLFDFNFFNVSTIDSFFQLVLRTFAREVDKPGNFDIELNDYFAMSMAAAMMLRELDTTERPYATPVGAWIRRLMEDKLEAGDRFDVFNTDSGDKGVHYAMVSFLSKMNNEDFKEHATEVMQYLEDPGRIDNFRRQMLTEMRRIIAETQAAAGKVLALCSTNGIDLTTEKMLNKTIVSRLYDWAAGNIDWTDSTSTIAGVANGSKSVLTADYKNGKKAVLSGLEELATKAVVTYTSSRTIMRIYPLVLDGIYYLGLMGHAMTYIDRFRRDNNLILLSDTNDLLGSIISTSDTPFIYERLGVQLHHFLIDEFQDTSRMQWHNLRPLLSNSEASDHDNLIIGDEKQSIYRFRNADAGLLHSRVAADFPHSHKLRGNDPGENTNYRSRENIVRFNNAFFSRLATSLGVDTYGNVVQTPSKTGTGGLVKLITCPAPNKQAFNAFAHAYTASEIHRFLAAGYRASDIAILVDRRRDGEAIVNYLVANHPDIKVTSDEALLVNSNSTVRLIVSVLQLVEASRHKEPATDSHGYAGRREVALIIQRLQFLLSTGKNLTEAIDIIVNEGTESVSRRIDSINEHRSSTLMSLVEYIEATLVEPAVRERDKAFIIAFNDYVADYCATHTADLHSFLRWWRVSSSKLAIPSAEDTDAVKVLTVHKSKGLQYQCVILPSFITDIVSSFQSDWYSAVSLPGIAPDVIPPIMSLKASDILSAEDSPFCTQAKIFRDANTLDALNLAYVAFTRAVSELTVIGGGNRSGSVSPWLSAGTADLADFESFAQVTRETITPDTPELNPGDTEVEVLLIGSPTKKSADADRQAKDEQRRRDILSAAKFESTFRSDLQQFTCIPADDAADYDDTTDYMAAVSDTFVASEERERGDILHRVLSLVHDRSDLEHAFERVAYSRRLDRERRREYAAILRQAFATDNPLIDRWFVDFSHTLNERPVYLPEREMTLRPDRVVCHSDGSVDIVDYKFTSRRHDDHITQVRGYLRLLKAMGYSQVRAWLWYLLSGDILEVTD